MKISNDRTSIFPDFKLGTEDLLEISEIKDLGVFFDSGLTFKLRISSVVANAKKDYSSSTRVL